MSDKAPLSITLGTQNATTSIPLIADNHLAKLRLQSITQSGPQGKRSWSQINFDFKLVDNAPTIEGAEVNAGFPIFVSIPLGSKDDANKTPAWAEKRVAQLLDALLGTGDKGNAKGKPARPDLSAAIVPDLIGKEMIGKIIVRKYTGESGVEQSSNDVSQYYFPADLES